jgi:hypothetical protein
LLERQA